MAEKIGSINQQPPTTPDLTFKNGVGEFSKEADISPNSTVSFEKAGEAVCRINRSDKYIEWKLEIANYNYGNSILSLNSGQSQSKKYQNIEFLFESDNYKVKETIVLKEKPSSNEFKLVLDTNYNVLVFEDSLRVFFSEDNDIENASFFWGYLETVDSVGLRTLGLYGELDVDENITFTINQDFLDNAVYPIYIDPTTFEISSSIDYGGAQVPTYSCTKSSDGWFVVFPAASGGRIKVLTAASDPLSSWSEEVPTIFDAGGAWATNTDAQRSRLVHFADGAIYFMGAASNVGAVSGTFREPGGAWDTSKAGIVSGNLDDNFDACATDTINIGDGNDDYIYMLCGVFVGTIFLYRYRKSIDTWALMAAPGLATSWGHKFACVYDSTNLKIHCFTSTFPAIRYQAYDMANNTWDGSAVTINSTNFALDTTHMTALIDSNGFLHVLFPTSGGTLTYANNISGWDEIDDLGTNYNTGCAQITSDDIIIVARDNSNYGGLVSLFEIGVDSSFSEQVAWWAPYNIRTFPKNAAAVGEGEFVWGIGFNSGTTTLRYLENDAYTTPSLAPPPGGAVARFFHTNRIGIRTPLKIGIR